MGFRQLTLYHIRTLINPHQTSLVSNADFPSDLAAIAGARRFLRKGEMVEVWRADKLVYRIGLSATSFERPPAPTHGHHIRLGHQIRLQSHLVQTVASYFEQKLSILAPPRL
jgi:hypothetical protein